MDKLRLTLLIVGCFIVLGIYLWEIFYKTSSKKQSVILDDIDGISDISLPPLNNEADYHSEAMTGLDRILNQSKHTLCFNWKDNKATTSRYHEALACGVIPMVYGLYDSTGILVKDDWQRVESAEELDDKIMNSDYFVKYTQIHNTYKQTLLTKDQIYDTFESKLLSIINEN